MPEGSEGGVVASITAAVVTIVAAIVAGAASIVSSLTSLLGAVQTPTTVYSEQLVIAIVRAPLSATAVTIKSVTIEAPAGNAGVVYVGNNAVTIANGYALRAGSSVSLDIADLNTVYVIGTAADVATYIAVN